MQSSLTSGSYGTEEVSESAFQYSGSEFFTNRKWGDVPHIDMLLRDK